MKAARSLNRINYPGLFHSRSLASESSRLEQIIQAGEGSPKLRLGQSRKNETALINYLKFFTIRRNIRGSLFWFTNPALVDSTS